MPSSPSSFLLKCCNTGGVNCVALYPIKLSTQPLSCMRLYKSACALKLCVSRIDVVSSLFLLGAIYLSHTKKHSRAHFFFFAVCIDMATTGKKRTTKKTLNKTKTRTYKLKNGTYKTVTLVLKRKKDKTGKIRPVYVNPNKKTHKRRITAGGHPVIPARKIAHKFTERAATYHIGDIVGDALKRRATTHDSRQSIKVNAVHKIKKHVMNVGVKTAQEAVGKIKAHHAKVAKVATTTGAKHGDTAAKKVEKIVRAVNRGSVPVSKGVSMGRKAVKDATKKAAKETATKATKAVTEAVSKVKKTKTKKTKKSRKTKAT